MRLNPEIVFLIFFSMMVESKDNVEFDSEVNYGCIKLKGRLS